MSETLTDVLPVDETASALRDAIKRLEKRRDAAIERRDVADGDRLDALRTPSMGLKIVLQAETAKHAATVELDRLALLRHDLSERLQASIEREQVAAHQAAVATAREQYQAAIDAFRDRLDDYERSAQIIAEVCGLEDAQRRAGDRFRSAVLAALPIGASLPGDPLAGIEGPRLGLADQVVLPPARPRTPFFWRREPAAVDPDALRNRTEAIIYGR